MYIGGGILGTILVHCPDRLLGTANLQDSAIHCDLITRNILGDEDE